jgi:ketosteroid isomerase-like protein
MSQENVERLHAFLRGLGSEVWETHGEPDLSLLDPDVVCEDDVLPDHAGESYRGHEGVIRSYRICL